MEDTVFALSSGAPPAAIAVVRVSGPLAGRSIEMLAGRLPAARRASLSELREPGTGDVLDRALILWFPGPGTATGEDLAEFHLHGGRSVVAAVVAALGRMDGLREARPGEFTRRAFEHGRIDLAQAEGLSDLLAAETQSQRKAALALAGGSLSRRVEEWQLRLLNLSAQLEAAIDFSDEGDVDEDLPAEWREKLAAFEEEVRRSLRAPRAERLKDGVRVAIGGPPNAGKSSLLNRIVERDAAIVSAIAGTTRDLIDVPVAIAGIPFLLTDTAGLRQSEDEIEQIGIQRAEAALKGADIILWLGAEEDCPLTDTALLVAPKADLFAEGRDRPGMHVSAKTGQGMGELVGAMIQRARSILPGEGEVALNRRHAEVLRRVQHCVARARGLHDLILVAEELRQAREHLNRITGRAGVEEMLDQLFGAFCIGK